MQSTFNAVRTETAVSSFQPAKIRSARFACVYFMSDRTNTNKTPGIAGGKNTTIKITPSCLRKKALSIFGIPT